MSYLHIENLDDRNNLILEFKECYAMEKIHGTSAHISYHPDGRVAFFSGGESHERFKALFDEAELSKKFAAIFGEGTNAAATIFVYGEAYGGKCQGMKNTYGDKLRFVAFEVKINHPEELGGREVWLNVVSAADVASKLGIDFVPFVRILTTDEALIAERDKESIQAVKIGMGHGKKREGVVLRPPFEVIDNRGKRVIAKFKADEFRETKTPRDPFSPERLKALTDAQAVAEEWVTRMRLTHVLDAFPDPKIQDTGKVISAMIEDIRREAQKEIAELKPEEKKAIATRTAILFKSWLSSAFGGQQS